MKLSDDVLIVLDEAECEGPNLRITAQLDRKLYVEVNKVLEAAGGKWNRKAKAHVFAGNAVDAVEQVVLTGEVTTPQEIGFFPTPVPVVKRLLALAELTSNTTVLEPSAGTGAIAQWLISLGCDVTCVEMQQDYTEKLVQNGYRAIEANFLALTPAEPFFDRVVMNPPFTRQADIDHVLHAWRFLKRSGRLVSVMSAGVMFRTNRKTVDFRDFVSDNGGHFEPLPDDAFRESGTLVRTVIAVIPRG